MAGQTGLLLILGLLQSRGDEGGWDQGGSCGGSKTRSDTDYLLKIEPARFAVRPDVGCERN